MFLQTTRILRSVKRPAFSFSRRGSGLLMHPTSLPGPHGCGDIGGEARRFADFLQAAGQTWWQMLPVGPAGAPPGNSPYSSSSSFAGSAYLIDLTALAQQGLLTRDQIEPTRAVSPRNPVRVNFPATIQYRDQRLRRAFERFDKLRDGRHEQFGAFCAEQFSWLDDYALFAALKNHFAGAEWTRWDRDVRLRNPEALKRAQRKLASEIRFQKFVQFIFDEQWRSLRKYCNDRGVGLIGDIPIFVAHDSADVWAQRQMFDLDRSGLPRTISGYPPDAFNVQGQRWGHPHYNWAEHRRQNYAWWIARFAGTFRLFDAVRIDHFLGFHRLWQIPSTSPTAANGKWIEGPGVDLFNAVRDALGNMPIIAEDLGLLTRDAEILRDRFKFPGMRIMEFGFGGGSYHLPHGFVRRCVAYTGTHDNDTIVGGFDKLKRAARRKNSPQAAEMKKLLSYLNTDGRDVHWAFIRSLMQSVADTVIFPVQDVLGLGTEARMNIPGTAEGNWDWRLVPGKLTNSIATTLRELSETYDRHPPSPSGRGQG
jgi:4-alpha-glucanotransferase